MSYLNVEYQTFQWKGQRQERWRL